MAGSDGTISFNTTIDTKGFNRGLSDVASSLKNVGMALGKLAVGVSVAGAAIATAFIGGYKMIELFTKKLAEGMSKTSFMYNDINGLKTAFENVKHSAATMFTPLLFAATPILMKITDWLTRMFRTIQMIIAALTGQKTIMQYVAGSASGAAKATGAMAKNIKKAGEAAEGALAAFDELNVLQMEKGQEEVGDVGGGAGLGQYIEVPIADDIMNKVNKIRQWFQDAWNWIAEKALWVWDNVLSPVWDWITTKASEAWSWLSQNVFAPIEERLAWFGKEIVPLILKAWQALPGTFSNIWKLVKDTFANAFSMIAGILGNVILAVSGAVQGIILTLGGIIQFLTGVFTANWKLAWDGIKNIYGGIWETMKALTKGIVNSIIDIVNAMIRSVIAGINAVIRALNTVKIAIPDWVPGLGGKSYGINLSEIRAPQIPKLATGAVIPPNAQFLAMLGDQRHGTNIEAPEELIRQIVREEGGGGREITINFAGSLGALVRELKPYIDSENARIGRSLVKRAVA